MRDSEVLLKVINQAADIIEYDNYSTRIYLINYPNILEINEILINQNMHFEWIPLQNLSNYLPINEINNLDLTNNLQRAETRENKTKFVIILCNKKKKDTQNY